MARLLIVAHAPLATTLQAVAAHAFPECGATLSALDVPADAAPEVVEARVRERLTGGETLVLVDVFGATPCNAALRAVSGHRARVVTGVNVAMLWRSICYAHEGLEALVERAVDGGTQGIIQAALARPQNQGPTTPHDDQDPHHHQQ